MAMASVMSCWVSGFTIYASDTDFSNRNSASTAMPAVSAHGNC